MRKSLLFIISTFLGILSMTSSAQAFVCNWNQYNRGCKTVWHCPSNEIGESSQCRTACVCPRDFAPSLGFSMPSQSGPLIERSTSGDQDGILSDN